MNYYVYYNVEPGHVAQLRPRVEALFKKVQEQFDVQGRLMRRRDDPTTYMEVYEDVKDEGGFEALLEREGAKLGVQRKLERFVCV